MPVNLSVNPARTRAALVFEHHPGNLLTGEIVGQLHAALTDLTELPHLRLVTLEGAGADFSFGASIPEHAPDTIARVLPATHALIAALLDVSAPTAAVVRGRCLGGGFELALACDFILAGDTATFGLPEIALGVFPPVASVLLPIKAGAARSASAIISGNAKPAGYWERFGVIEAVEPDASLAAGVDGWFSRTLRTLLGRSASPCGPRRPPADRRSRGAGPAGDRTAILARPDGVGRRKRRYSRVSRKTRRALEGSVRINTSIDLPILIPMLFNVEIVLKGRDVAVTEAVSVPHGEPGSWNEAAVRDVLVEILRAIERAQNPAARPDRAVALRGFSWIVEPAGEAVVLAVEIPMGAAVAGPFAIGQAKLDAMITGVLRAQARPPAGTPTIH